MSISWHMARREPQDHRDGACEREERQRLGERTIGRGREHGKKEQRARGSERPERAQLRPFLRGTAEHPRPAHECRIQQITDDEVHQRQQERHERHREHSGDRCARDYDEDEVDGKLEKSRTSQPDDFPQKQLIGRGGREQHLDDAVLPVFGRRLLEKPGGEEDRDRQQQDDSD